VLVTSCCNPKGKSLAFCVQVQKWHACITVGRNNEESSDFCRIWVQNNALTPTNFDTRWFSVSGRREKLRARSDVQEFSSTKQKQYKSGFERPPAEPAKLFLIWTWPADDPPVGEMERWKNKSTGTGPREPPDTKTTMNSWYCSNQKRTVYTLRKLSVCLVS